MPPALSRDLARDPAHAGAQGVGLAHHAPWRALFRSARAGASWAIVALWLAAPAGSSGCTARVDDPTPPGSEADVQLDDEPTGTPASAPTCGLVYDDPGPCEACFEASCCDAARACAIDDDCLALLDCLGGCDASACGSACVKAHPRGTKLLRAVVDCVDDGCSGVCPN